ncbi:MAG TPA: flagellar biosynthetic protein FliR [Polyangiaceae bacterium]|nr:flagellar biosynthetic protein FliR [Polyangiaceae bacterium]
MTLTGGMVEPGLVDAIVAVARASGQDLAAWGIAWARVMPTVLIVPAFGLGLLPAEFRVAMGLALATAIAPSVHPVATGIAWPAVIAVEAVRGVPVAIAAAVSLWAATVAGGTADTAIGTARLRADSGLAAGGHTPLAVLFGLLAAMLFLELGGATRIALRLATLGTGAEVPLAAAVRNLSVGIDVAASVGAPLLVVGLTFDVTLALASRELPALRGETFVAPLRTLVVLVATAAVFDRVVEWIGIASRSTP